MSQWGYSQIEPRICLFKNKRASRRGKDLVVSGWWETIVVGWLGMTSVLPHSLLHIHHKSLNLNKKRRRVKLAVNHTTSIKTSNHGCEGKIEPVWSGGWFNCLCHSFALYHVEAGDDMYISHNLKHNLGTHGRTTDEKIHWLLRETELWWHH